MQQQHAAGAVAALDAAMEHSYDMGPVIQQQQQQPGFGFPY